MKKYNTIGQLIYNYGWQPATAENAQFAYTVHGIESIPPLTADIYGDSYLQSYATGNWTATASGGSGSTYNFKWYVRPEYSSWSLARNVTTSSNVDYFSMSAAASNFDIKVDVTRGSSFYMEHPFLVFVCSEDPCMVKEIAKDGPVVPDVFSLEPGYPNPFNPTTIIPVGASGKARQFVQKLTLLK